MIKVGATHVIVNGYRAVIIDQYDDWTVDAQILLREGIGPVVRGLKLQELTIANDQFDVSKMPDEVAEPLRPSLLKRVFTLGLAKG